MMTVVGSSEYYFETAREWLRFFREVIVGLSGRLHLVSDHGQEALMLPFKEEHISCHHLNQNNSFLWVTWKFGHGQRLCGKGLTFVWEDFATPPCSKQCGPLCGCRRFIPLGNYVLIENRIAQRTYFDIGFGLQRLASLFADGDEFALEPMRTLIRKIKPFCGGIEKSRKVVRLLGGILRAIQAQVRPGPKLHGYVLRKLIRRLLTELQREQKAPSTRELERILELASEAFPRCPDGWQKVVLTEAERFCFNLQRNLRAAEKFARTQSTLPTSQLVKAVMSTYGLPRSLSEEVCRFRPREADGNYSYDSGTNPETCV
jgi:alanyl-tRNA synthetase